MTVSSQNSRTILQGNGVTTTFSANFELPAASDLIVEYIDTTGAVTTVSSSHYTLSGVGDATGFSITYPLSLVPITTGTQLVCYRDVPYTQPTTLSGQSNYTPESVMDMVDNVVFQTQQLKTLSNLAIRAPIQDTALADMPTAADRADSFLFFDSNGDPTTASQTSGLASAIYVGVTSSSVTRAGTVIMTGTSVVSVASVGDTSTFTINNAAGGSDGQIQFNNSGALGGFTMSGDMTITTAGTASLATVNSNVGTFTNATVTVNGKGLITAAANGSGASAALVLISTASLVASASTVDFTGITNAYDSFMIRASNITSTSDGDTLLMRVGTGGGPTYDSGTNYSWSRSYNTVGGAYAWTGSTGATGATAATIMVLVGSANPTEFTIQFKNPSGSTYVKLFEVQGIQKASDGGLYQNAPAGAAYTTTTAVTAIRFLMNTGSIATGFFELFGYAKS